MKTYLIFDTEKLIKKISSKEEFYEIKIKGSRLYTTKKYNNKRGRPFSVNLPNKIRISPEVLGLIVGEGFIGDRRFVFANSNEKVIDEVIEFLRQFNLPIKFYLEISNKGNNKHYEEECKRFWENHLKLKINKIRLRNEFFSITPYGTIHVLLNNSLFAKLLKYIIVTSKKRIERNRLLSIGYLKGIIAAEGNINMKKSTSCVYMIRISASKQKERNHYKKCLEKVGIKIYCEDMPTVSKLEAKEKGWKTDKGRAGAVIISRWDNFLKVFELGLLDLHKLKKDKFLQFFIYNKFTKQFLDFGYFLNKEFTMKEAQNYFGFIGRRLNRVLTMYKKGYLSRRKINQVKFSYKLTDKYKKIYNLLNDNLKLNSTPFLKSHS